uniref:Uncharacterized protein n=1 Tax=Arundo donax TaxID=35708 RepID=A0A0A9CRX3_ARUDO
MSLTSSVDSCFSVVFSFVQSWLISSWRCSFFVQSWLISLWICSLVSSRPGSGPWGTAVLFLCRHLHRVSPSRRALGPLLWPPSPVYRSRPRRNGWR